jgi:hypothetical protein
MINSISNQIELEYIRIRIISKLNQFESDLNHLDQTIRSQNTPDCLKGHGEGPTSDIHGARTPRPVHAATPTLPLGNPTSNLILLESSNHTGKTRQLGKYPTTFTYFEPT